MKKWIVLPFGNLQGVLHHRTHHRFRDDDRAEYAEALTIVAGVRFIQHKERQRRVLRNCRDVFGLQLFGYAVGTAGGLQPGRQAGNKPVIGWKKLGEFGLLAAELVNELGHRPDPSEHGADEIAVRQSGTIFLAQRPEEELAPRERGKIRTKPTAEILRRAATVDLEEVLPFH